MSFSNAAALSFLLSAVLLCLSLFAGERANSRLRKPNARRGVLTPFQLFLCGLFVSIFLLFYPLYYYDYFAAETGGMRVLKTIFLSIHNSMRLFILDGDFEMFKAVVTPQNTADISWLFPVYSGYSAVLFVVAPLCTATVVLSFFQNIWASLQYFALRILHPRANIYLFSVLDERSLTLAENISAEYGRRKALLLFADVTSEAEYAEDELAARANRIGAVCFRKPPEQIGLRHLNPRVIRKLFLLSEDDDKNVRQALALLSKYRESKPLNRRLSDNPPTAILQLFVFAETVESETLLNSVNNSNIKVRHVRQKRNLALHLLQTYNPFTNALPDDRFPWSGERRLRIGIVGLGRHGTELFKAFSWCLQMPGYIPEIHIFDRGCASEQVRTIAPELYAMAAEPTDGTAYRKAKRDGEAYTAITFHDGVDAESAVFFDTLAELPPFTALFVNLGDDARNIQTAVRARTALARTNASPPADIFAVVYSSVKNELIDTERGLVAFDNISYDIRFIGSLKTRYSLSFIEQTKLENDGLTCHLMWARDEAESEESKRKYEAFEYHRRSSVSKALHLAFRAACGCSPTNGDYDDAIEHIRWNAYLRSEGYVYGTVKNEVAKTHDLLVPNTELPAAKARRKQAADKQ